MRQSRLKNILKSERYYYHCLENEKDSDALRFGRAFHAVTLLPPKEAETKISTLVPINPSTKKPYGTTSQKFLEAQFTAKKKGWDLITPDEGAHIFNMASRAREAFLDSGFDFDNCNKEIFLKNGDYTGTLDLLQKRDDYHLVGDLKKCHSIDTIDRDIDKFHYDFQAAWYIDKLLVPLKFKPQGFYFFFVEDSPPYDARIVYLDDSWLDLGRMKIKVAEARLKRAEILREQLTHRFQIESVDSSAPKWLLDKWSELAQSYEEAPF